MVVEKEFSSLNKGPVYPAKYIYFITNANRTDIKIGITENLIDFAKNLRNEMELFQSIGIGNSRLVYFEEYDDVFKAKERFRILNKWTRIQKEKLIRLYNQEWTDLSLAILYEGGLKFDPKKNPVKTPGFNYN